MNKLIMLIANLLLIISIIGCGGGSGNVNTTPTVTPTPYFQVSYISCGDNHSLAITSDGTVWGWGMNAYNQLGDYSDYNILSPRPIKNLSGVFSIVGGGNRTIALKTDGTVWTLGYDLKTGNSRKIPVQVSNLNNVKTVAAGDYITLAIKNNGTVWAWGSNYTGQLGNGTNIDSYDIPVQVSGLYNIIAIAAGGWSGQDHCLALDKDGTVYAWGWNYWHQLGNGDYHDSNIPIKVNGLSNIVAISAGSKRSLALKNDGTVWGWGDSYYSSHPNPTLWYDATTPIQVEGLSNIIAISEGDSGSLALKNDGTVWTWGYYLETSPPTMKLVSGLSNIVVMASGEAHKLALKNDGTVWAWGQNGNGQLGNNSYSNSQVPIQVNP